MGVRFPSAFSNTRLNLSLTANVETFVVTTPPLVIPLDSAVVFLCWYVVHTVGTTATTTRFSLRRNANDLSNVLNQQAPVAATAGNAISLSGCYIDTTPGPGGQQYSLTGIDIGATAAGAIADAALLVFAL